MDLKAQKFEEKMDSSSPEISELYDVLSFDNKLFEDTFRIQLKDERGASVRELFLMECFSVAFGISAISDLKDLLKESKYSDEEIDLIIKGFDSNFLVAFRELNVSPLKEKKESVVDAKLKSPLDITSSPNPITENTISHVDILSEIENPTPSISTTAQFIKPAVVNSNQPTSNLTANTQSPTQKTTTQTTPTNPLDLGGFGINKANTVNPAQNIANKLDQNLSTPTTSIPKEVYVSKKLDPYKEPII